MSSDLSLHFFVFSHSSAVTACWFELIELRTVFVLVIQVRLSCRDSVISRSGLYGPVKI
jgi:hypothetical protein